MKTAYYLALIFALTSFCGNAHFFLTQEERDSIYQHGKINHENMMAQLGITEMRPGPSGDPASPNAANYNESTANPCPELPEILVTNNGKKVKNADDWWNTRRPEIVEDFEREVYGRLPENIPDVTWTLKVEDKEFVRRTPVIVKQLVGHVDNSSFPSINVDIKGVSKQCLKSGQGYFLFFMLP